MSKEQPWKNFAKISQDAEGNWVLNVLGRELFVRAYGGTMEGDTDECVIVIGNRRMLDAEGDEGTIEAEFVFEPPASKEECIEYFRSQGDRDPEGTYESCEDWFKLLTAHVLKGDDVLRADHARKTQIDYLTDDEVDELIQKGTAQPPQWYSDLKAHYSGNDPEVRASILKKAVDKFNNMTEEERRALPLNDIEDL